VLARTLQIKLCRRVGDYYRSFQVSETIDAGKISAQYANGVLTLHLPKTAPTAQKRIEVKVK